MLHFLIRTRDQAARGRATLNDQLLDSSLCERLWIMAQWWTLVAGETGMRFKHVELSFSVADMDAWTCEPEVARMCGNVLLRVSKSVPAARVSVSVQATAGLSGSLVIVREFPGTSYTTLWLDVPRDRARRMFVFALQQAHKPPSPPFPIFLNPVLADGRTWYCLSFVIATLQAGGLMRGFNSQSLTTDDLYEKVLMYHRRGSEDV